jgi:hypothetical protein
MTPDTEPSLAAVLATLAIGRPIAEQNILFRAAAEAARLDPDPGPIEVEGPLWG